MLFSLIQLDSKYADTCEQCDSEEKPVYQLKGQNQNLDTFLCPKCLGKLKRTLLESDI